MKPDNTKTPNNPDPEPPPLQQFSDYMSSQDINQQVVRLIDIDDHNKGLLTYDAELYEGRHDGVNTIHLTRPYPQQHHTATTSIHDHTININLTCLRQDHTPIATFTDYKNLYQTSNICMRVQTDEQQIDSGANKSVTDDKTIK